MLLGRAHLHRAATPALGSLFRAASTYKPPRRKPPPSFAKVGLPFIVFMIGGYVGLTEFVGGKVERGDLQKKSQSKREFSLEEERRSWEWLCYGLT